ncbi:MULTISPECIES: sporulation protein YqfC [unclassified Clostridium]|uniref:sporulation protein YqfC n=1 Tax=unclassified Clostridium TaxID=2614128 RepID=UPI00023AF85B|nr:MULTISPECIES: sporulation protein YqfC [unclassified Clostridium]EHI98072.1 sporulation protein YqfC [Clostridium sp. DL-VIII]OOM81592.1 YabP family protein [Clostridium sp. BL-8]
MEEKFQKGREKILNKLDFPSDISLDLPKIIVVGDREITIENHKGIIFFETNMVKINSRIGAIVISGRDFEILFIAETSITISGVFKGISYEAKNDL